MDDDTTLRTIALVCLTIFLLAGLSILADALSKVNP